uniref:F-box associated domain-containing protein n=1 Tax=Hordeum vulgare subsp. vulgare TaxID=112509 RepID=A0A8I6XU37_HORVV
MLDYVVCNPATKKWVTVPATKWCWNMSSAFLGFDPAVSSHFYVFELVAAIAWNPSDGVFLSGVLYLCYDNNSVAAVDLQGNCRIIPIPTSHDASSGPNVYVSRGQLYLTIQSASELSFWVLEDSSTENCWTLKLNISHLRLFGIGYSSSEQFYGVISAHPEHNMIFITKGFRFCYQPTKLFSYELDSGELRFICDLSWNYSLPYLSYVPLFSESLADGN